MTWLLLGLALCVRLVGLEGRPLWYDEAFSVLFARQGPAAILVGTLGSAGAPAADIHPIVYYGILWTWMGLLGTSPAAARLLSVFFGFGALLLAYGLGREVLGRRPGPVLLLCLALAPFQVHYAQEARMYAQLTFFLIGATWALWRGLQRSGWLPWLMFALCATLAQYSHNLAFIYLVPLALTPVLLRRWRAAWKTLAAGLLALLLYLPWLVHIPAQIAKVQAGYWIERPAGDRLITALLSYVVNLPLPGISLVVGLFITLLVTSLAAWQTLRMLKAGQAIVRWRARRLAWLAYLGLAPLGLLLLISQFQPVFIERALLPAGMVFILWLGAALVEIPVILVRRASLVLLLGGMLLGLYWHLAYTGFPYAPYPALAEALTFRLSDPSQAVDGEVIIHANKLSMLPMVYYAPHLPQTYLADIPGSGSDTLSPATQRVLGLLAQPDLPSAVGDARRVTFILFRREIDEYLAQGLDQHPHLAWLGAHFSETGRETWGDLLVVTYAH
jgi:4-amino-4-deoxy-L-arabinose transferase-like glycosyltransferase